MSDHRKGVRVLYDEVGPRGVHISPPYAVLMEDIRRCERVLGSKRRILDERRRWIERARQCEDGRQFLVLDTHESGRLLRRLLGLRRDKRDRLAMILGLADCEDGAITGLRAKSRDRLRKIGGSHDQSHAGDPLCSGSIDRNDASMSTVQRDKFRFEGIGQPDIGHVFLYARHSVIAAAAMRR